MFYMRAERDYKGRLIIETLAGFIDDSLVLGESEFLKEITHTTYINDTVYGIVSCDVQSILLAAY